MKKAPRSSMAKHAKKSALTDWPLRNDQIVLSVLGGRKQREVAEEHGLTHQQISNIIRHPKAEEIIAIARNKLRDKLLGEMEDKMDLAAQASLKVLQKTLNADISPVHKAKSNQDRVALKILSGRGFLRAEERGEDGGLQMTGDQHKRLMEGLAKASRVRQIDPYEDKEIPVVEAKVVNE